ncbi:MAG: 3-deoxy-manno-octulosonate cytidylyltransferase [Gammaproteobacteria bacterium]|nr:3-deoxy-manno-octulosonate cytidylyltransferase [Gammaproteobacteria bacterium]
MSFTVIIPARLGSRRLPGKPLLEIGGLPMVQHTWQRAQESNAKRVVVATDDPRIIDSVESFGGEAVLTSWSHQSGTDRLHEAAGILGLDESELVVNLQADEPLLPAVAIGQVAENLEANSRAGIATLCEIISSTHELEDPNVVKVVRDTNGFALYFSRSTIPHGASVQARNCFRHIGLYAYRVSVLNQFVSWPLAELEELENLEQLRALSQGVRIHVGISNTHIPAGIDTEADLEAVRHFLRAE